MITSTSIFTDIHDKLHAAQKCGRFVAYCLRDKPEVVADFTGLRIPILAVFSSRDHIFQQISTKSHT